MTDSEIVKAVAEKVMGWHERKYEGLPFGGWKQWADSDEVSQAWAEDDPGYDIGDEAWNPLTNDADACAVLDRMGVDEGEDAYLIRTYGLWSCRVHGKRPAMAIPGMDKDEARRRVICIAALRAVGVEVYNGESAVE